MVWLPPAPAPALGILDGQTNAAELGID